LIDVSVLSANPKFACTGKRIIKKTYEFGQVEIQLYFPVLSWLCHSCSQLGYQNLDTKTKALACEILPAMQAKEVAICLLLGSNR